MGLRDLFGGKPVEVTYTEEELGLAPLIAAARGIVSRDESQRENNINAVCQELAYKRQIRMDTLGH